MIKPLFLTSLLTFLSFTVNSQNLQLHYDFGKQNDGLKRHYFVSTFELFRPDSNGYTFLFTDFEFNSGGKPRGASLAYFEISRTFSMPFFRNHNILKNLMLHAEYNDGVAIFPLDTIVAGTNLAASWLGGIEYGFVTGNLTLNAMILYKYTQVSKAPDAQFTLIWYYPLMQGRIVLTGYIDVWSQDNADDLKVPVFYTEPQVWFYMTKKLALGSEFKISKNFIAGSSRIEVFPTLGLRWDL